MAKRSMMSAVALRQRLEKNEFGAEAAIRSSLEAIESTDGDVRAFTVTDPQGALRSAKEGTGPLRGIAVGVKDIIDTANMPTEMGSPIYAGWQPRADAALVMLARRAGASIIGKTKTTAFAQGDAPDTRNPHDLGHTPGGSSSGSAAAVAAGMVPLAFGTQTGGSVIRPASFCGVAAIKPSYRLLPTAGIKPYSISLDTAGIFAATVADAAFALAALTDRIFEDGVRTARIAVVRQDYAGEADASAEAALKAAALAIEASGMSVFDAREPAEFAAAWKVHPTLADGEALRALAWEWETHRAQIPPKLTKALADAERVSVNEFDEARRLGKRARLAAHAFFKDVDAAVTFAAPGAAPKGLNSTGEPKFNRLWTLLGVPCVNVPGCRDQAGLPIGVQVIAPFGRDSVALEIAARLERALSLAEA